MKYLKGKVTEVRQTEHGRFAVIAVRDERHTGMDIYDYLHLACDPLTVVGDEISALIALKEEAK